MELMIQYDTLLHMHSDMTELLSQRVQVDPEQAPCPQDCARGTEERMGAHDEGDLEGKAPRPVPERVRAEGAMTSEEAGDGLKVVTHVMKEEEDVTLSYAPKSQPHVVLVG